MEWTDEKRFVFDYLKKTGSTWMPIEETEGKDLSKEIESGGLVVRYYGSTGYITLPYYAEAEENIRSRFTSMLLSTDREINITDEFIDDIIRRYENGESYNSGSKFAFNEEQKDAIRMIARSKTAIITGGPGTGKTSVVRCAVQVLKAYYNNPKQAIIFSAPTGKATARLSESVGMEARTLHSFVGFKRKESPIKAPAVLFVDEFSMADIDIVYHLVQRVLPCTRLFFLGDNDQLQCVGRGAVLRDLINSQIMPVVQLKQTYRQDDSSTLFDNIQIINEGAYLPLKDGSDFKCIRTEENIVDNTVREYLEAIEKYGIDNTVILTPLKRKTQLCSDRLNRILQMKVNPPSPEKTYFKAVTTKDNEHIETIFRVGDPVIQTENTSYVANGEVGRIIKITDKEIIVKYPLNNHPYKKSEVAKNLELAYAMTIHKSQGSQYECVIMPIAGNSGVLDRSLIYTGVSRAKKKCVVIAKDKVIQEACKRKQEKERITLLREELDVFTLTCDIRTQILQAN